jgi:hypothetical protein
VVFELVVFALTLGPAIAMAMLLKRVPGLRKIL